MNIDSIMQDFKKSALQDKEFYYNTGGIKICKRCNQPRMVLIGENLKECFCQCQKEQLEKLIKDKHEEEEKGKRETERRAVLPFVELRKATFENSTDKESKAYRVARGFTADFDEHCKNGLGILFYGETGAGKTYFEGAIANELINKNKKIVYENACELISLFDYGNGESIRKKMEDIKTSDLFILDDLGSERATDTAISKIYQIINSRYMTNKSMIVSTNFTPEQMKTGEIGNKKRIFDRIYEVCYPVKVEGNKRKIKALKNFEAFTKY